jgi:cytoskeletal protein CcmA (bactofilin family)
MDDKNQSNNNDLNTLEDQGTTVNPDGSSTNPNPQSTPPKKKKRKLSIISLIRRVNIYLLFFVLIVIIAGVVVYIGYQRDQEDTDRDQIHTERLTPEELEELAQTDTRIGDPQQLLTVESNTVFTGQVLVRDNLDVAGQISVGGSLSLPGITVSGTSNFEEIQAESLSIGGDTNIQGQLTVDGGLSVGGSGSFGGNLTAPLVTAGQLQLDGDLQVTRHIDTGGPTPAVASGGSIGSGGTVSISGSDTAGTVTINPGGGAGNGPVASVTFANAFNQTPHIVVTPVGRSVSFYITRTTTGFTIHVTQNLTAGSFAFDYHAFD